MYNFNNLVNTSDRYIINYVSIIYSKGVESYGNEEKYDVSNDGYWWYFNVSSY